MAKITARTLSCPLKRTTNSTPRASKTTLHTRSLASTLAKAPTPPRRSSCPTMSMRSAQVSTMSLPSLPHRTSQALKTETLLASHLDIKQSSHTSPNLKWISKAEMLLRWTPTTPSTGILVSKPHLSLRARQLDSTSSREECAWLPSCHISTTIWHCLINARKEAFPCQLARNGLCTSRKKTRRTQAPSMTLSSCNRLTTKCRTQLSWWRLALVRQETNYI